MLKTESEVAQLPEADTVEFSLLILGDDRVKTPQLPRALSEKIAQTDAAVKLWKETILAQEDSETDRKPQAETLSQDLLRHDQLRDAELAAAHQTHLEKIILREDALTTHKQREAAAALAQSRIQLERDSEERMSALADREAVLFGKLLEMEASYNKMEADILRRRQEFQYAYRAKEAELVGPQPTTAPRPPATTPVASVPPASSVLETSRPERVRVSCRGTLVPVHGFFERGAEPIDGVARDMDQEGACVTTHQPPAEGSRVVFKLRLPETLSSSYRGLRTALPARVRQVRALAAGRHSLYEVVLQWDRPLAELVKAAVSAYRRKIGVCFAALAVFGLSLRWSGLAYFWYAPLVYLYGLAALAFLVSRYLISWLNRTPPITNYTPSVSMVISVRNEESSIAQTIASCFATVYPADKREVIVVDDGSTDATPRILQELTRKHPGLVVRSIKPSGKRFGMAEGIRLAKGEILVFLDSDTYIYPDAVRRIVCGFEDPALGAVAGYTKVVNADKNALTGLQDVRYLLSFRLLKAAESFFGCVTCCPGCLSAYRRKYVLEVLDAWVHQSWFGQLANLGDDRSLTNHILRKYRVTYNDAARASTVVPETWGHYMRQQVRWKRSWLRETWVALHFMWKKHPVAALSFYGAAVFSLLSPAIGMWAVLLHLKGQSGIALYYLLGLLLLGLINSLYYRYQRASPRWLLGFYWMAASFAISGPQTYYALVTVFKNNWGTR